MPQSCVGPATATPTHRNHYVTLGLLLGGVSTAGDLQCGLPPFFPFSPVLSLSPTYLFPPFSLASPPAPTIFLDKKY